MNYKFGYKYFQKKSSYKEVIIPILLFIIFFIFVGLAGNADLATIK